MHDRLKVLLCKMVWDVLPTKLKVANQISDSEMSVDDISCVLCGEHPESFHQILLVYPFSWSIWSEPSWQLNIMVFGDGWVADWVQKILHPHQLIGIPLEDQHLFQIFAANVMDLLWATRNQLVHRGKRCDVKELAHCVRRLSWEHKTPWQNQLQPNRLKDWKHPPERGCCYKKELCGDSYYCSRLPRCDSRGCGLKICK